MVLGLSTQFHQNFKVVSSTEILHLRFGLSFETHSVKEMAPRFSISRSKLLRFIRENNHLLITSLSLKSCGISFRILIYFLNALVVSVYVISIRGWRIFKLKKPQLQNLSPLPSINKAHSLFIQEEMQRSVTNSVRFESTILATKSLGNNPKGKERPLCTHCGKLGHTVDKCYKLYGFPLGYKFKNRNMMAHQVSTIANQFQSHYLASNTDHNLVVTQF